MKRALGTALGWTLVVILMPIVYVALWVDGVLIDRERKRHW